MGQQLLAEPVACSGWLRMMSGSGKLLLQLLDALGDGGLGDVQALGGTLKFAPGSPRPGPAAACSPASSSAFL